MRSEAGERVDIDTLAVGEVAGRRGGGRGSVVMGEVAGRKGGRGSVVSGDG